jgi:capsular exopolysaccharide synthesis family protein
VSRSSQSSVPAESYRSLRTSIQFISLESVVKTVQFTSPNAAEGKTTTLANLAVVMAQSGQRVITVCCDFRRPRLHEFFNLSNHVGFTSVLLGEATLENALQPVPGLDNLRIMASGQIPPNPSELLSGARTGEVLARLAEDADIVLVDSPPILPVTDAAVLASRVDAVVMVVAAGISVKSQVSRALETLGQVDASIAGLVLNRAAETDSYAYYQYAYGGVAQPEKQRRNTRRRKLPQEVASQ